MQSTISESPSLVRDRGWMLAMLMALTGCAAPLGEGEPCSADEDCAAGTCETIDGLQTCSSPCALGDECPAAADGAPRTCREDGHCGAACTFAGARDGRVCRDGAVLQCSALEAADACESCGCDVFGGGICVEGTGCVQPGPEGAACTEDRFCESRLCEPSSSTCVAPAPPGADCTMDRFCASGLCEPSSSTCVAPAPVGAACTTDRFCASELCNPLTGLCTEVLVAGDACESDRYCASGICGALSRVCVEPGAIGDPCSMDRECESSNCSTDGDATRVGACNQPLGEECDRDHCNRCLGADAVFGIPGYCGRLRCDPATAPCGPPVGPYHRVFDCRESTEGPHYCYETCPTNEDDAYDYSCLDALDRCHWNTGSCW